jgi:hypothetical protein
MEMLSKYISYQEAIISGTAKRLGLPNVPTEGNLKYMVDLAVNVIDLIIEHFGSSPFIHAFFVDKEVNKHRPGADPNSRHTLGQAVDLDFDNMLSPNGTIILTNKSLFTFIVTALKFDKVIWEMGDGNNPDWVHVQYNKEGNRNLLTLASRKTTLMYTTFNTLTAFETFKNNLYK